MFSSHRAHWIQTFVVQMNYSEGTANTNCPGCVDLDRDALTKSPVATGDLLNPGTGPTQDKKTNVICKG